MAYNPNAPADDQFLADFPAEQREQQRALKDDQIVDASKLRGMSPGNANGNIPVSNGNKCANLNADMLDGHDSTYFAPDEHGHAVASASSNGFMSNTDKNKLDGIDTGAEASGNANRVDAWTLRRSAGGGKFAVCDKGWAEIDCGEATHDVVPIRDIWRFFTGEEFPA